LIVRILRVLSYLYHSVLALFLIGISIVSMAQSTPLRLEMLPWKGEETSTWLLSIGIIGLLSVGLAITGIFRFLFPAYALVILVLMVRGYLLQPYTFEGPDTFYKTLYLILGALLAFLFSLTLLFRKRKRV
jgi:hypothetical protein